MADVASLVAQALGHERAGRAREAVAAWEAVLALDPGHVGALLKLGVHSGAAGRADEATRLLERALAQAVARGANALPIRLALAQVRAAAEPADATAWLALGGILMEIELQSPAARDADPPPLAQALAAFDRALALAPDEPAILAQAAMAQRYACEWPRADACVRRLEALASDASKPLPVSGLMATSLLGDPALQRRAIADFAARTLPSPAPRAPAHVRTRGSRLRVGYLSADFHEHATAHLAAGVLERHDRTHFETFAYALDRDDGSAMRRRLAAAFTHWRDVATADDEAAAAVIARDGLDVLVDMKGHTQSSRLAILASRPAPVQVHWLGFPGTLAWGAIDALVADPVVVPPDDEAHYAERILRMPHCYQPNDRTRPLPPTASRASVGLPENAVVLVSFNQTYKLSAPFVAAWLDVLARRRDTVLWLIVPHAPARRSLRAAAHERGVAPERIVFAPVASQHDHLARLRCADLALDVLPYGSHTTGSDALWCGVPLLTCAGATFAGRVGASLLHAARLDGLVTASIDAYRERLDALVARRDELAALKAHLERERHALPLFDTEGYARDFERLLEDAASLG